MAQHNWIKKSLGVALLLAGGIFFGSMTEAYATEEAPAPKSIKLGVDPDQYLKNRHRRVQRARRTANSRAATRQNFGDNTTTRLENSSIDVQKINPNLPDAYAGAPGFNEFSYLSDAEKDQAGQIMKFLEQYQGR